MTGAEAIDGQLGPFELLRPYLRPLTDSECDEVCLVLAGCLSDAVQDSPADEPRTATPPGPPRPAGGVLRLVGADERETCGPTDRDVLIAAWCKREMTTEEFAKRLLPIEKAEAKAKPGTTSAGSGTGGES